MASILYYQSRQFRFDRYLMKEKRKGHEASQNPARNAAGSGAAGCDRPRNDRSAFSRL